VLEQDFNGSTYNGSSARGVFNPASDLPATLSGASFAWEPRDPARAGGGDRPLHVVGQDKTGGKKTQVGKVLIIKSDREGFQ